MNRQKNDKKIFGIVVDTHVHEDFSCKCVMCQSDFKGKLLDDRVGIKNAIVRNEYKMKSVYHLGKLE